MTLIVTAHVPEGIVMAADSRLTITNTRDVEGRTVVDVAASQTDTACKLFLAANRVGISTFGAATLGLTPIAGFIEQFLESQVLPTTPPEAVPQLLVAHFGHLPKVPDTGFHVAGYAQLDGKLVQHVWRVSVNSGNISLIVPGQQSCGILWNGEIDVMSRLFGSGMQHAAPNGTVSPLPSFNVPVDMFTLQDALDFAVYAIRTTADTMKFQMRPKTVGGPIDVLILKPNEALWLSRKSLRVGP
jgi:hypothetical protein